MRLAARPPLARIAHIDQAVRGGRRPNARSLARELEVNPRTIERDLQFLRDRLGAPLAFDVARNGYAYTDASFRLPFQQLTEGELLALFLAERLLQEYRHRPYAEELARAFKKITIALPDTVSIDLSHLAEAYAFRPRTVDPGDAEQFGRLNRAVREGRQIELTYWSASHDETTCRVVDPYHLASVGGDWFLVGYCHLREEVRMFAPGRIRGLRETGVRIERPADFRIAEYLDAGFGAVRGEGPPCLVRLQFRPAIARYVRERRWHPSQQIKEQKDGSLVLTLKVNDTVEVRRWVLSFGADCEILEPKDFRDEIVKEVIRSRRLYGDSAVADLPR